jgi:lipopolysaccharide transport system permease protein
MRNAKRLGHGWKGTGAMSHLPLKPVATLPVRVYSAHGRAVSFGGTLRRAARELWSTRGILWRLFLRDLSIQYRQKLLGYAWAFLQPLCGMASFLFLHASGMFQPGETGVGYPLYLLVGTSLWGLLVLVTQAVSGSLQTHADLLLRTALPRITLAVSALGQALLVLGVQYVMLVCFLAYSGELPGWGALFYPLLLVPLLLLGLALGLMLAILSALARDFSTMVLTGLGFLMYLTPVVYSARFEQPVLQALVAWNPLSHLIDGPRHVLLTGEFCGTPGYLLSATLSLAVFFLCLRGFYLIQDLVAERL